MRFLLLINSFALFLAAMGVRGEKLFEESTETNLDINGLNEELRKSQRPESVAFILSSVKDKSLQILDSYTVEDFLNLNTVTFKDCKKPALKRRADFCIKLDGKALSSTANADLSWYCDGTLVQVIRRCYGWRDEAKVRKYLSEAELEIIHNLIKFGHDYNLPRQLVQFLRKGTQMTGPLEREKIFDESSEIVSDDKSLMAKLSSGLKPVEVIKLLSGAKNKRLELLVGKTVQDYLNLNTITVLDCEKSNLISRTRTITDPSYFHRLDPLERNLNGYARDLVLEIVDRCYKKRDNPVVSSSWSKDELKTLHGYTQNEGSFAFHKVEKYLIPGRYRRNSIKKEYIVVERRNDH